MAYSTMNVAVVLMSLAVISSASPMRRTDYSWITSTTSSSEVYDGDTTYGLDTECNGPCGTALGATAAAGCVTCAASFCTTTKTDPSCTWATSTDQTSDYAASIAEYTCQTCTSSTTDERCSVSWLNANLLTSHSGLKGAYCNDKWLVIFSDGSPGFLGGTAAINLGNIPQPPSGTDQDGTTACRTRSWWTGLEVWKVPLRDYYELLSTSTRFNNLEESNVATAFPSGASKAADGYLNSDSWGIYALPSGGSAGFTIAGQSIFPVFADSVDLTPQKCEVDGCNEHVGQGGGAPHLHGDPFGSECLYDATKYVDGTTGHPPVIGFSMDGPTIYGRYLSESAPGYSTALDDCGGHTHDSYVYHYHAQVKSAKGNTNCADKSGGCEGADYPAFPPGPDKCWKANIAQTSGFWDGTRKDDTGTLPCCGMTHYYVATGIAFNGAGTLDTSGTTFTDAADTYTGETAAAGETAANSSSSAANNIGCHLSIIVSILAFSSAVM